MSLFFFTGTAPAGVYTLSLHDALPIYACRRRWRGGSRTYLCLVPSPLRERVPDKDIDRKSTRLNSSHTVISYAVFCLKKKNKSQTASPTTPTTTAFMQIAARLRFTP